MSWRSWSRQNPCPVCRGHRWVGGSAQQCRGGYNPELSEERIWCSIENSGAASSSGNTWEWELDEIYPWDDSAEKKISTAGFSTWSSETPPGLKREGGWNQTGEWRYRDAQGAYRFSVFRYDHPQKGKEYRPGRREQSGESELVHWGLPACERIPYQLSRLREAIKLGLRVYIVEGEKSADSINDLDVGLRRHTATTLPCGSAQWNTAPEPHCHFAGARGITVIVDRDSAGESWARDVAKSLRRLGPAPTVRFVRSRTAAPGDDVVDHLEARFELHELKSIELT